MGITERWAEGDVVVTPEGKELQLKGNKWVPYQPGVGTDIKRSLPQLATSAVGSVASLNPADFIPSLMQGVAKLGTWGFGKGAEMLGYPETAKAAHELGKQFSEPTTAEKVQSAVEKATGGPLYQPKTTVGKAANIGAQFIPGATLLGSSIPAALRQTGALTAANALTPQGWEPLADIAASTIGSRNPLATRVKNTQRYAQGQRVASELPQANLTVGRVTGNEKQLGREARASAEQPRKETEALSQELMKRTGYSRPEEPITSAGIGEAFGESDKRMAGLAGQNTLMFPLTGKDPYEINRPLSRVMNQSDAIVPTADKATFNAFADKIRNSYPTGSPMKNAQAAGLTGNAYVQLRKDLGGMRDRTTGPLQEGYRGLIESIDNAMRRTAGGAFDEERKKRQLLATIKEPGSYTPAGTVDVDKLAKAMGSRGAGQLDPATQQLVTDAQAIGLGQTYPRSEAGGVTWPLVASAMGAAAGHAMGGLPGAIVGGLGGSAVPAPGIYHSLAEGISGPFARAASRFNVSPVGQYIRQPGQSDMVRALLQASPYLMNQ